MATTFWSDTNYSKRQLIPQPLKIAAASVAGAGFAGFMGWAIGEIRHDFRLINNLSDAVLAGATCEIDGRTARIVDRNGETLVLSRDFQPNARGGTAQLTSAWQGSYRQRPQDDPIRFSVDTRYPTMCNVSEIHFPTASTQRRVAVAYNF